MGEVINYFLTSIQSFIDWLFQIELVEGVSFGSFAVACLVLTIIISFVFTKLVGSVK